MLKQQNSSFISTNQKNPSDHRKYIALDQYSAAGLVHPALLPRRLQEELGGKVRLAEFIFGAPRAFYLAYSQDQFDAYLGFQAWGLAWRSRHIKPPKNRPDLWGFAYRFNADAELTGLYLVRKSNRDKLKPGYRFVKHLDMSLVSVPGPSGSKPWKKLIRCMERMFFDGQKPTVAQCKAFFANDNNFDLSCREHHFPKVPRLKNRAREH